MILRAGYFIWQIKKRVVYHKIEYSFYTAGNFYGVGKSFKTRDRAYIIKYVRVCEHSSSSA